MAVDLQMWEEILGTLTQTQKIKTIVTGIPRKAAWGDSPVGGGDRAETVLIHPKCNFPLLPNTSIKKPKKKNKKQGRGRVTFYTETFSVLQPPCLQMGG